ncbi:unnamed protein product [Lactuca virosa]|uniref:Uncharacterized protein n=1 Tax=Lactuca virosa TaxID=75947 RepID=A0AAU9LUQ1_9ASTR|nr:unnamed protein product [Lactuca virosa]
MLPHLAYRNSLSTVSAAAYRLPGVAMWFYCSCKSFCSDNMFMVAMEIKLDVMLKTYICEQQTNRFNTR